MTLYYMSDATRRTAGTDRLVLLRSPAPTTTHTHTHTSRPCHEAPLARQPLLRRQRISSVFNRTGASSNQWTLTVVVIDGGNTNTKGQALSRLLRLRPVTFRGLRFECKRVSTSVSKRSLDPRLILLYNISSSSPLRLPMPRAMILYFFCQ
jgi:hypothetical protein